MALGCLVVVGSEQIVNQANVTYARTLDKDTPEGYRYMPLQFVYKVRRVTQDAGGTDPTIIPCNI